MKTPEDDEFDRIEREQAMGWRKRQIVNEIEKNMNNEPVAWMSNGKEFYVQKNYCPDFIPLYTHPVKELTDEEINEIVWQQNILLGNDALKKFARAILRKAQEK